MNLDSQWKIKRVISNIINSDKKQDLRVLLLYITFALKSAPRDNLYSQLVFERVSNHQEKNRMEQQGLQQPSISLWITVSHWKNTGPITCNRVTHINSKFECFEFHSHSLMKINEKNWRLSSISHYFPEVIQNPS